jgi:hypothetical protein
MSEAVLTVLIGFGVVVVAAEIVALHWRVVHIVGEL